MKTFHLDRDKSPTHANLVRFLEAEGWKPSSVPAQAAVNEDWLLFSPLLSQTLEYKHLLAAFLQENQLDYLMPTTFFIDDENWPLVLNHIAHTSKANWPWILKPSMLNNGQHIHIFPELTAVEAHFVSHQRMGGPQVLQRYLVKPQLIQGPSLGHKFSIRELLVISTHAGSALFPSGYLNIALKPYQEDDFKQLAAHLTNEHLSEEQMNVVQRLSDEIAIYQPYKEEIIAICRLLIKTLKKQFPKIWQDSQPRIACFGVDFMVEAKFIKPFWAKHRQRTPIKHPLIRPLGTFSPCLGRREKEVVHWEGSKLWLLEINHGPCFPVDEAHPLFKILYRPFWQELIKGFIEGKASRFISLD